MNNPDIYMLGGVGLVWCEEIGAQKMHEGPSRDGEFEECSFAHG